MPPNDLSLILRQKQLGESPEMRDTLGDVLWGLLHSHDQFLEMLALEFDRLSLFGRELPISGQSVSDPSPMRSTGRSDSLLSVALMGG